MAKPIVTEMIDLGKDIMKSVDRIPKKELSGKYNSRHHEILLPRLIESDEEDMTEDWILGTHGNQQNKDDRSRIIIGYHELIKLNLTAINESYAVYQKFEVNLSSPGRGLVSIHSAESEGMMDRFLQHEAATGAGCMPRRTEKAELSIITEQRFIRRICLNNRAISMEVDLS